jgi:signal transduction histidine kinase
MGSLLKTASTLVPQCVLIEGRMDLKNLTLEQRLAHGQYGAELNAVLGQISAGVAILEAPSGRRIHVNKRITEIFREQDFPEAAASRYQKFVAYWPNGKQLLTEDWQSYRSIHQGISVSAEEVEIVRGDGTHGFVTISSDPIRDETGKVEAVVLTIHDITELRRQQLAARVLDEATQLLFSDLDYEKTLSNFAEAAVRNLGGWVRVSLVRESGVLEPIVTLHEDPTKVEMLQSLRILYPFSLKLPNAESQTLLSGKTRFSADLSDDFLNHETSDRHHADLIRKLEIKSTITVPLKSKQSSFGVIKFGSYRRHFDQADVQLAEELGKRASLAIENALLYKKAQDAARARDEFLSIASHELKTPLTSLFLHNQLRERNLAKGRNEDFKLENLQKFLAMDRRQIDRLIRLVDDMLDVSRISSGRLSMNFGIVDFSEMTQEVIQHLLPEFRMREIELTYQLQDHISVKGDRVRLEQLIENLLTNALKYGMEKPVKLELLVRDGKVIVKVQDHGLGIPPEHHERIFHRFERAISNNEVSGLGLGLHISREIANAHGGTIQLESELGKGATFILEIPM